MRIVARRDAFRSEFRIIFFALGYAIKNDSKHRRGVQFFVKKKCIFSVHKNQSRNSHAGSFWKKLVFSLEERIFSKMYFLMTTDLLAITNVNTHFGRFLS